MLMSAAAAASGQGTVVAIGLDIYAVNNFSGPAAEAGMSLKKLQSEFKRTMYENLRVARNMYGGMAAAGGMLLRGMNSMYQNFIDFDYVMKGTQIVSQATQDQFRDLRGEALRLGETTMFYADDIANSMREMAKAGQPVEDILNNIGAAVAGAGSTMETLNTATRAIISTLAQFQIPSENAMDVMDKLVAATTGAKNTMPQLSDALKYSAADFYALEIPLEHALGMLMTMHNFGIEGSMAGTAMGNALRYLSKAMSDFRTSRQMGAMEIFGFTEQDFITAQGGFKDMVDVFGMIMKRIREMESVKAQTTMEALFGIRGKRAAFPMAAASDQVAKNIERINRSQAMSLDYLDQMMNTQKGQYIMMRSAWQTARIAMGEAMEKFFAPLFRTLRGIAQTVTILTTQAGAAPTWVRESMKYLSSFLVGILAIKTAVWAIKAGFAMVGMITSNVRISFDNMNKSMATAWAGLKAQALGYKGVIDGLIVSKQRLASTMVATHKGQHMLRMGMVGPFGVAGSKVPTFTRKGRGHPGGAYQFPLYPFTDLRTRKTYHRGTPLPTEHRLDHSRTGMMGGGLMGVNVLKGQTAAAKSSARTISSEATKKGIMGAFQRLGVMKILGALGKFLMGPWGIAAFILLPPLISRLTGTIRDNTRSVKENTRSQKTSAREEKKPYDTELFDTERVIKRLLDRMAVERKLETGEIKPSKKTEVVFNVDGKHMFRSTLDDRLAKQMFNMGLE